MSRRTSESNKAILAAWNKEQELVREGKGTRDWTPEQQQDILDKGKAYDENARAFEGQHMKSAEKYPEYRNVCKWDFTIYISCLRCAWFNQLSSWGRRSYVE